MSGHIDNQLELLAQTLRELLNSNEITEDDLYSNPEVITKCWSKISDRVSKGKDEAWLYPLYYLLKETNFDKVFNRVEISDIELNRLINEWIEMRIENKTLTENNFSDMLRKYKLAESFIDFYGKSYKLNHEKVVCMIRKAINFKFLVDEPIVKINGLIWLWNCDKPSLTKDAADGNYITWDQYEKDVKPKWKSYINYLHARNKLTEKNCLNLQPKKIFKMIHMFLATIADGIDINISDQPSLFGMSARELDNLKGKDILSMLSNPPSIGRIEVDFVYYAKMEFVKNDMSRLFITASYLLASKAEISEFIKTKEELKRFIESASYKSFKNPKLLPMLINTIANNSGDNKIFSYKESNEIIQGLVHFTGRFDE